MHDIRARLATITRPHLLISAARFGLDVYKRQPALRRLLGVDVLPPPCEIALRLIAIEAEIDAKRRSRTADYRVARHVAVLVALMAEAQDLDIARIVPFPRAA